MQGEDNLEDYVSPVHLGFIETIENEEQLIGSLIVPPILTSGMEVKSVDVLPF